jgi:hypothetical protein
LAKGLTRKGILTMKNQEQIHARQSTKWALCLATALILSPCFAQAQSVSASDNNSTLRYNLREPFTLSTVPSSPVQFPGTIEWTVDGRRILVYPSIPGNSMDVEHYHPGAHVGTNQIHVQGPLFGYASSDVTVGIVYSVNGGTSGSGESRISEKVDIRNKSSTPLPLSALTGLGWLPDPTAPHNAGIEVPDWTGLNVTGTTVAFIQGDVSGGTPRPSITDAPFGPVTVLPATSFTGFNPFLVRNVTLAPGATLTVVTELKLAPPATTTPATPTETSPGTPGGTSPDTSGGGASPSIPEDVSPDTSGGTNQNPSDGVHQDPWKKMHHRKDVAASRQSEH